MPECTSLTLPLASSMLALLKKQPYRSICKACLSMTVSTLACMFLSTVVSSLRSLCCFISLFFSVTSAAIPAARFAASHQAVMNLTDAQVSALARNATTCGYDKVLAQVTYPPHGKIPLPNGGQDIVAPGCDLYDSLWNYGAIRAFCCHEFPHT